MSAETIYKELISAGMTPEGACGVLGNMYAESTLKANIAQRGMTSLTDAEYTAAADAGTIDFVHDGVGYGLCQWTYYSRKQALLDYAKSCGTSVGDETMQVWFAIKELKSDYSALWTLLCSTTDIGEAASKICTQYERPAVNNITYRSNKAQEYYEQLAGVDISKAETTTPEAAETASETYWPPRMLDYQSGRKNLTGPDVLALQAILQARGFSLTADGDFGSNTRLAVIAFQAMSGLTGDGVVGNDTWTALLKRS